ncbi:MULTISPECIES: HTTM domain-containing protein [Halorussus]|uniref:HTTM domain-containing protein n=1 Tax=Halorussus TaxID=1070314 RepID=UPI0020A1A9A7|nr:HTTM domain-containing protein [Halorussus vallis]USZ74022.1 HTTM domain-containing protein [Halorussus vallis]
MTTDSTPGTPARRLRSRGRDALARRFGVDARALAALRISLGLLLIADALGRSRNLVAFYTDAGVLPRAALRESYPLLARFSLHALSGSPLVQAALLTVAVVFGLALLSGYRTRLATAGSLVLLVSLHARNPLVLNGGDALLRRLLFWGLFLPLGERWSADALRRRGAPSDDAAPRRRVASVASAALLVQVVLVYTVNAGLKLRGDLWLRGEAVRYVLSLDQFTVLLGDVLANYPTLLGVVDRLWLGMLVCSVLLIALTGRARTGFVALFVGTHLGMALTMRLGLFPLISVAALLAFLPSSVWDVLESNFASPNSRGGEDAGESVRSPADSRRFGRLATVVPSSTITRPGVPRSLSRWASRLAPLVAACLLVALLGWNAAVLVDGGSNEVASADDTPWGMFAPEPMQTDGWYVVPAELASGDRVDAFHRRPVRWDRPTDVARSYPTARWRKYLTNVRRSEYAAQRRSFAGFLCERWNRNRDDELTRLAVYFVAQPTRLDGPEPTRRVELGRYSCSDVSVSG